MDWKLIVAIGLIAVLGLSVANNQITLSVFMLSVAFVAAVIFLFMQKREIPFKPIERYKEELMFRSNQPGTKLRNIMLSGGKDKYRYYSQIFLGRIRGWTKIETKLKSVAWTTLYVFRYTPLGKGFAGKLKYIIFNLPILSKFRKDRLFICNETQLGDNDLTAGDIIILGVAIESIAIFDALNTKDLDKEMIMSNLGSEVNRLTLEYFLNELPVIIDEGIKSSPGHQKVLDILHGRKEEEDTYAIQKGGR